MSAADEGRTEKATAKQRQKFRDEGSVAKSQELNSFATFLVGFAVINITGAGIVLTTGELMIYSFTHLTMNVDEDVQSLAAFYLEVIAVMLAPIFAALIVGIIAVSRAQFDFQVNWKAIQPKFTKVNPFKNFKKVLISPHSLMEGFKSVLKVGLLSAFAYMTIMPMINEFLVIYQFDPIQIGMRAWAVAQSVWLLIIVFMGILGIGDFLFQRYQTEEKMKMARHQVEDEQKQSDIDPKIKAKLRQRAMQMLQKLMQEQTAGADVVITNPTHFAVALQYKHGEMGAPKIVAKGIDHLALKIKKIARKNEIPMVENRGLARALYHKCEVGDEIPDNLFKPVAEILAFIYRVNKQRATA